MKRPIVLFSIVLVCLLSLESVAAVPSTKQRNLARRATKQRNRDKFNQRHKRRHAKNKYQRKHPKINRNKQKTKNSDLISPLQPLITAPLTIRNSDNNLLKKSLDKSEPSNVGILSKNQKIAAALGLGGYLGYQKWNGLSNRKVMSEPPTAGLLDKYGKTIAIGTTLVGGIAIHHALNNEFLRKKWNEWFGKQKKIEIENEDEIRKTDGRETPIRDRNESTEIKTESGVNLEEKQDAIRENESTKIKTESSVNLEEKQDAIREIEREETKKEPEMNLEEKKMNEITITQEGTDIQSDSLTPQTIVAKAELKDNHDNLLIREESKEDNLEEKQINDHNHVHLSMDKTKKRKSNKERGIVELMKEKKRKLTGTEIEDDQPSVPNVESELDSEQKHEDAITITFPCSDHEGNSSQESFTVQRKDAEKSKVLKEMMEKGETTLTYSNECQIQKFGDRYHIQNPSLNCLTSIRDSQLDIVLPQNVCLSFDNSQDFKANEEIITSLSMTTELSSKDEIIVTVLMTDHDGNPNQKSFILKRDIAEKSNLLKQMMESENQQTTFSIKKSKLKFEYNHLNDFENHAETLKSLDANIELDLEIAPANLENELNSVPNLTHLKIKSCQLYEPLDMSKFPELPRLQVLTINKCQLENLSSFLERTFLALEYLDFSENGIGQIRKLLMPNLVSLNLSNNRIENLSQLFESDLSHLKYLRLDKNKIKILPKIEFMLEIEEMNLYMNQIKDISEFLECEFSGLKRLNLSFNKIEIIPKIHSMKNLEELSLSGNEIKSISEMLDSVLLKLRVLNLSANKIEHVPEIQSMHHLEKLCLSWNYIKNVLELFKSELPELKELNLKKNRIEIIPTINSMQNLEKLDLSFNHIENVSDLMNKKWDQLKVLDLSVNKIKNIPKIESMANLEELNLYYNSIQDVSELMESDIKLKRLNIEFNQLNSEQIREMKQRFGSNIEANQQHSRFTPEDGMYSYLNHLT